MSTDFPVALDSLTNPAGSQSGGADKLNTAGVIHGAQHANTNDAIEALETKVGIDGSADTGSLDYRVNNTVQPIFYNLPVATVVEVNDEAITITASHHRIKIGNTSILSTINDEADSSRILILELDSTSDEITIANGVGNISTVTNEDIFLRFSNQFALCIYNPDVSAWMVYVFGAPDSQIINSTADTYLQVTTTPEIIAVQNGAPSWSISDGQIVLRVPEGVAVDSAAISSGRLSVNTSHMVADTEGGAAADDLDGIFYSGSIVSSLRILIQCANASRVITVKHNTGATGEKIFLQGATDAVLDDVFKAIQFVYSSRLDGGNGGWNEVARNF